MSIVLVNSSCIFDRKTLLACALAAPLRSRSTFLPGGGGGGSGTLSSSSGELSRREEGASTPGTVKDREEDRLTPILHDLHFVVLLVTCMSIVDRARVVIMQSRAPHRVNRAYLLNIAQDATWDTQVTQYVNVMRRMCEDLVDNVHLGTLESLVRIPRVQQLLDALHDELLDYTHPVSSLVMQPRGTDSTGAVPSNWRSVWTSYEEANSRSWRQHPTTVSRLTVSGRLMSDDQDRLAVVISDSFTPVSVMGRVLNPLGRLFEVNSAPQPTSVYSDQPITSWHCAVASHLSLHPQEPRIRELERVVLVRFTPPAGSAVQVPAGSDSLLLASRVLVRSRPNESIVRRVLPRPFSVPPSSVQASRHSAASVDGGESTRSSAPATATSAAAAAATAVHTAAAQAASRPSVASSSLPSSPPLVIDEGDIRITEEVLSDLQGAARGAEVRLGLEPGALREWTERDHLRFVESLEVDCGFNYLMSYD